MFKTNNIKSLFVVNTATFEIIYFKMKYDSSKVYVEKNTSSEFAVFWSMVIHVHRNS